LYAYRWCLCEEIIRNKFFSNYNHSCFINIVSFELELTSYISFFLGIHSSSKVNSFPAFTHFSQVKLETTQFHAKK
jgi:hypothetical protein